MSSLSNNQVFNTLVDELSLDFIQQEATPIGKYNPGGLYFLLHDNEIVYVGKSNTSIGGRIAQHLKDGIKKFNRYFVVATPFASPEELLDMESQAISKFRPMYNATVSSCKTYVLRSELESLYGWDGYLVRKLIHRRFLKPSRIQRSIIFSRKDVESIAVFFEAEIKANPSKNLNQIVKELIPGQVLNGKVAEVEL